MKNQKMSACQERKICQRLIWLAGLSVFFIVHLIVFNLLLGGSWTFSRAKEILQLSQEIRPDNPVETVGLEVGENLSTKMGASGFRILQDIPSNADASGDALKIPTYAADSGIINFKGKVIYPNSLVLLQIKSEPFVTSVQSDNQGNWEWTNNGAPLEAGLHSIETYNISPFELTGKRDVYAKKYLFEVESDASEAIALLALGESGYVEEAGDDDLGERFIEGKTDDLYDFKMAAVDKKVYDPGEEMAVQLVFSPIGQGMETNAQIKYEIYAYGENEAKAQLAATYYDSLRLTGEGSFIKRIQLKEELAEENYFLTATVQVGADRYVQTLNFFINPKIALQIGEVKISAKNLALVLTWDIILILTLIVGLMFLAIREVHRLFVYRTVTDSDLRKSGYF